MPKVEKVQGNSKPAPRPAQQPARREGVWAKVRPVTEHDRGGIRMSIYGQPKAGKTRFVSTFPKPVLIIGTASEDGSGSISTVDGVDFAPVETSQEIAELLAGAISRGYATVAIDTASRLQDMILTELLGLSEIPVQLGWGIASKEQWGQVGMQMKTILRVALDLPCNVVVVAHERNFGEDAPAAASELILPHVTSALSPGTAGWLNGAVDYICQCFKRKQMVEKKTTVNGQPKVVRQATGKVEYCLRTGPHVVYQTGFRLPHGVELPDCIVDPTYDKVIALIEGR